MPLPRTSPTARSNCARSGRCPIELARDPSLRAAGDHSNLVWVRITGKLPDDPLLHVCLMTYISDLTLLETALLEHGVSWYHGGTTGASLDHAMWFHRPFRADQWLLYAQESPVAAGGRVLARGRGVHGRGRPRGLGRPGRPHQNLRHVPRLETQVYCTWLVRNLLLSRQTKSQVKNVLPSS